MAEGVLDGRRADAAPPTPTVVKLFREDLVQIGFTGRELAAIREHTGHSLSELLADETTDDKFIVLAWLKLRREGHALDWDDMQDVVVDFQPVATVADPSSAPPSATSPRSVTSGA